MIEIEQLSKRYQKNEWALQNINLTIGQGMFGLLGPNGAGKTTLMRILATLIRPTAGTVTLNGRSLKDPEEIRKIIGYLPQFFQIYPQMTGIEFLDYVGAMKGIKDKKRRRQQIETLLEQVNLVDKGRKKVKTYSGGMRQRLGIAQALMGDPEIIIVDEPTAGLDPEERVRIRNLMTHFSQTRTVILSTHIVSDIETSCPNIGVINKGELLFAGNTGSLQAVGKGRVWEFEIGEHELDGLSHMQIVTSKRTEEGILCKVIADQPPQSTAKALSPSLEDGYLALLRGDRHV